MSVIPVIELAKSYKVVMMDRLLLVAVILLGVFSLHKSPYTADIKVAPVMLAVIPVGIFPACLSRQPLTICSALFDMVPEIFLSPKLPFALTTCGQ